MPPRRRPARRAMLSSQHDHSIVCVWVHGAEGGRGDGYRYRRMGLLARRAIVTGIARTVATFALARLAACLSVPMLAMAIRVYCIAELCDDFGDRLGVL